MSGNEWWFRGNALASSHLLGLIRLDSWCLFFDIRAFSLDFLHFAKRQHTYRFLVLNLICEFIESTLDLVCVIFNGQKAALQ